MDFFNFIQQNLEVIFIFFILLFLFWNILLEIRLNREGKRTAYFFKGRKIEDLEGVISEILKRERNNEEEIKKIFKEIKKLDEISLYSIQKIGIIRFNPFKGVGGNQSFSLAILDQKDDGVIVSSYYSRNGTRIYAKPVKQGESTFPLTKEEEETIKKAVNR